MRCAGIPKVHDGCGQEFANPQEAIAHKCPKDDTPEARKRLRQFNRAFIEELGRQPQRLVSSMAGCPCGCERVCAHCLEVECRC